MLLVTYQLHFSDSISFSHSFLTLDPLETPVIHLAATVLLVYMGHFHISFPPHRPSSSASLPRDGAAPQDAGTFQISLVTNGQYSPFGPAQWPHVSLSQGPQCLRLGEVFLRMLGSPTLGLSSGVQPPVPQESVGSPAWAPTLPLSWCSVWPQSLAAAVFAQMEVFAFQTAPDLPGAPCPRGLWAGAQLGAGLCSSRGKGELSLQQ